MKKYLLAGTALLLTLNGGPAFAQDIYSAKTSDQRILDETHYVTPAPEQQVQAEAPPQQILALEPAAGEAPANDFSGPYIGADAGYNFGNYDINDPVGPDGDIDLEGFEGGAFAGYGFTGHVGNDIAGYGGIELGYEWSEADEDFGANSYEKNHNWLATFRPGVILNGKTLAYGMIGYSMAEFEGAGDDEDADGLVLGGGLEIATAMPVNLRLEYGYTNYEDVDLANINLEGEDNAVKAGLLYRF